MGRQEHEISRAQIACSRIVFKSQPCCSAQDHYPFVGVLIVPIPVGRCLAVGDNPFDPQAITGQQGIEDLTGFARRQVVEQLSEFERITDHPG